MPTGGGARAHHGAAVLAAELVVDRGGHTVLPGLSLEIGHGVVTGLLGPSGSGKTTLLRSIVGVQRVRSGAVTVLGLPAGSAPLRRRVGYMTQSHGLYLDLTVQENLLYFGSILGAEDRVPR